MSHTGHVVWDNLAPREVLVLPPEKQFVLACLHCGDRYVFVLPAPVDLLGACLRAYAAAHADCEPGTSLRARAPAHTDCPPPRVPE